MRHMSDAIAGDLGKLNEKHAAEIRRVAGSDTSSTTVKGSARPVPFVDGQAKASAHHDVPRPIDEMLRGGEKPPHDWPAPTKPSLESGTARPTFRGPMPSREAPPR